MKESVAEQQPAMTVRRLWGLPDDAWSNLGCQR